MTPLLPCEDRQMIYVMAPPEVIILEVTAVISIQYLGITCLGFSFLCAKFWKTVFSFGYCFKAVDCATLATNTVQVSLERHFAPGAVIIFHLTAHYVAWQVVGSKGLTASQRWCCNPPGLPARCTVVSDGGGGVEGSCASSSSCLSRVCHFGSLLPTTWLM